MSEKPVTPNPDEPPTGQAPGSGGPDYADSNERDIRAKQAEAPSSSAATRDDDLDTAPVRVLPGTGGPDDVGDIEVDPDDFNLSGHG